MKTRSVLPPSIFLVFGVLLVHLLHLSRFYLAGRTYISAFPDYVININLSLYLSLLLLLPMIASVLILTRYPKICVVLICFIVAEITSQIFGRSLIKFVTDLGLWSTVVFHYIIEKIYGRTAIEKLSNNVFKLLHSEVLGILRIVVTASLFVIGTLGITVASKVISKYFGGDLGQSTAWCYIISLLYLAYGMFSLLMLPLFKTLLVIREKQALSVTK